MIGNVMIGMRQQFAGSPRSELSARGIIAVSALLACGLSGCGEGPKARFGWRESTESLIPAARIAVQKVMTDDFGTPLELVGWERMPINYGGVRAAVGEGSTPQSVTLTLADPKLAEQIKKQMPVVWLSGARKSGTFSQLVQTFDAKTLRLELTGPADPPIAAGDQLLIGFGHELQLGRETYMKNCTHCHGVAGDGEGPTAKYLNPKPRDYRMGTFKFTSTQASERATRDDLHRIVEYGIPGTYMPSFLLMKPDEKIAVVDYIRWLAMRGEMEKRLGDELADYNEASIRSDSEKAQEAYNAAKKAGEQTEKPVSAGEAIKSAATSFATYAGEEFPGVIDETADFIADGWKRAEEESSLVIPKQARVADSVESRERGRLLFMSNRTKCYTCHGPLGRGDGGAIDDFWPKPGTNEKYSQRGLHDFWGNKLPPRDLTKGQYRGGRRPLDLYRRMFAGIKGTPMPAFGTVLKDEEIWDLVNYVMNIPFEPQSPSPVKPAAVAATSQPSESGK